MDPSTHEDLSLSGGSWTYYGPHHHVQMTVTSTLTPTYVTLHVVGLQTVTAHTSAPYLPATCLPDAVDPTLVTCEVPAGTGLLAVDVVVDDVLDVSARVWAPDNDDPVVGNDTLTLHD